MKFDLRINLPAIVLNIAIITVVILGLVLRYNLVTGSTGYFYDDYRLLNQLMNNSYIDLLTKPMDDAQICPPLFAILLKFISYGGNNNVNHFILELVSFLGSCLALIFMPLAVYKIFKSRFAALLCSAMLAFNSNILIYTTRIKQYSTDILLTIILIYAGYIFFSKPVTRKKMLFFSLLCIISGLFSYTSIIVIACLLFYYLFMSEKDMVKSKVINFIIFIIPWLIVFIPFIISVAIQNINNPEHRVYWHYYITNFADFKRFIMFINRDIAYIHHFYHNFFTIKFWYLFLPILTGSLIIIFKKERYLFCVLILPFILSEILGICKIYPCGYERTSLWMCPVFFMLFSFISLNIKFDEKIFRRLLSIIIILYYLIYCGLLINGFFRFSGSFVYNNVNLFIEELRKSDITDNDTIIFLGIRFDSLDAAFGAFDYRKDFINNKKIFIEYNRSERDKLLNVDGNMYLLVQKNRYDNLNEWLKDNMDIIYEYETKYGDEFVKAKNILR